MIRVKKMEGKPDYSIKSKDTYQVPAYVAINRCLASHEYYYYWVTCVVLVVEWGHERVGTYAHT